MENELTIIELLNRIDPSTLDYGEWIEVGTALKNEGNAAADWDNWYKSDSRYQPGNCFNLWDTLEGSHNRQYLSNLANKMIGNIYIEKLSEHWDKLPADEPQLIKGLLRRYQKMAVCGPRRSGKTMALVELATAVAEGSKWLEWDCVKGKVLYINLGENPNTCMSRFHNVYSELEISPTGISNIEMVHLRGKETTLNQLTNQIVNFSKTVRYRLIIIDSIDNLVNGEIDWQVNLLIDKMCYEVGCCMVYSHSVNRDKEDKKNIKEVITNSLTLDHCDTYLEFVELTQEKDMMTFFFERLAVEMYSKSILKYKPIYYEEIPQDDFLDARLMQQHGKIALDDSKYEKLLQEIDDKKVNYGNRTAWRCLVRSKTFPNSVSNDYWFEYPTHSIDGEKVLSELEPGSDANFWKQASKGRLPDKEREAARVKSVNEFITKSIEANGHGPTKKELAKLLGGVSTKTVERRVKESGEFALVGGRYQSKY